MKKKKILRCLKGDEWTTCTDEYDERVQAYKEEIKGELEQNPFGFYGQINKATGEFCVRDVSDDIPEKGQRVKTGRRCINWLRPELARIAIVNLKMKIPDELSDNAHTKNLIKLQKLDKARLVLEIKKQKQITDFYTMNELNAMDKDELLRILFYGKLQRIPLCKYMQAWFAERGLLVESNRCGVS